MTDPTDEELLEAWRGGDTVAADALIQRHFGMIFRFFRAKLPSQAKDLTQRTFLACAESAAEYRGDGPFRAFLLAIARNHLFKALRKEHRSQKVFDPLTVSARQLHDPDGKSLTSLLADRQTEGLLLHALRSLPLDMQITLELFYWEDMSLAEIATVLDIAVGTVKSRLGRARSMLRVELERLSNDPASVEKTLSDLRRWAQSLKNKLG